MIDRQLVPLVRGDRSWPEVPAVLMQGIESARLDFPAYERQIWAHALDWLANAHEYSGEPQLAILCLEARLRLRTPRNPFRCNQYVTLVTLLEAIGEANAARAYAQRGANYCRDRNRDAEAALLRKIDQPVVAPP
jgi:hypothetical protein